MSATGRYEELYRAHITAGVQLGYLLTGDAAAAEDAAHDAFLKAAGRLAGLSDPDRFGAYYRRCVAREVLMRRRSATRERLRQERVARPERVEDPAISLGDGLELVDALRRLSERQRTAVVLRYWHDLSEAQIARHLRCRPGTVKSLLSRGLAALRQEVEIS